MVSEYMDLGFWGITVFPCFSFGFQVFRGKKLVFEVKILENGKFKPQYCFKDRTSLFSLATMPKTC